MELGVAADGVPGNAVCLAGSCRCIEQIGVTCRAVYIVFDWQQDERKACGLEHPSRAVPRRRHLWITLAYHTMFL